jgi:hypothetical protein
LVIGRTVTASADPEAAAERVTESAQSGLALVRARSKRAPQLPTGSRCLY